MSDKKVSISSILNNHFPSFIGDENPLFVEFLNQYFISQESEYGTINLAENIPDYKNISSFSKVNTQTTSITLTQNALSFDETIYVSNTSTFPEKYGLLKVDNEIITYTGKTSTSFTGCIRGFSGISKIESDNNPEFLTFTSTSAQEHNSGVVVTNLSFIFLNEFFKKFKNQFIPGFENRNFYSGISVENFLSSAKTFYASKGTAESIKILFRILYGKNVEVINPFDDTIKSSDAEWISDDEMMVEAISGNPLNLKFSSVYQDSLDNPTAFAIVSNVEEVFLGTKKYYKILLSKKSINGKFEINNKTKVVSETNTEKVVTVDSTIGFAESGDFYYLNSNSQYTKISYESKSHNQFFGCVGLSTSLNENDPIISGKFIHGYENNDKSIICSMRVVGSISQLNIDSKLKTKYFSKDDLIGVDYLGEKIPKTNNKFNSWFYNNVSYIDVSSVIPSTNTIITVADHYLHKGDKVDVIRKSDNFVVVENSTVSQVINSKEIQISVGVLSQNVSYILKKRINYVSSNLNLDYLLSDIQNSFVDKDKNCYVAFSGYPSYSSIETTDRGKTFSSNNVTSNQIAIVDHNFLNGEKVFYKSLETSSGIAGITTGVYYVGVVDSDHIKLYLSRENLYINASVTITGSGADSHKILPERLADVELRNQNNFKRILDTPQRSDGSKDIIGPIGVGLNGIELYSPISNDSVFYGQIEKINILNPGEGYDVIYPPDVNIADSSGNSAHAHVNLSGSITGIVLDSPGFDYTTEPVVTIKGGNGSGAVCEAKLKGYIHSVSFSDNRIDLSSDIVSLANDHRFLDGEEVVYTTNGLAIGIGSTNIGFTTSRLSNGGTYYIAKLTEDSFSIASTKERALNKSNLIDFLSFGNKTHTFTSTKTRKIIDKVKVIDPGSSYSNKKVLINSQKYPPEDRKNIFKTFVGINTVDNYIFAKNHSFNEGDVVEYLTTDTTISGLSTSNVYKVSIVDADKFKLALAGTATTIVDENYNKKIYAELNSVGVGTHTFKYPDIVVNISGSVGVGSTNKQSYYDATASVSVNGYIDSVFVKSGGVGYGITNIINLIRRPVITLKTGKNGEVKVIVNENGEISSAYIANPGSEYTSPPKLEVIGAGKFAELKATVSNGSITSVSVINSGKGYTTSKDTFVRIIPSGKNALFSADIHEWKINDIERHKFVLDIENYKGTVQRQSEIKAKGKKLASFYATKEIRTILGDNIDQNTLEELDALVTHSPIIGWSYDGNPIYGPFGNAKSIPDSSGTGGLKRLVSGYQLDPITDPDLRPSVYQEGYFIEDYVYKATGDLDEYNGRYIVNSDFPNGTYAYFSTLDSNKNPYFPYISFKHRNKTDQFNYDYLKDQSDFYLNNDEYRREVTFLGINEDNRKYPFFDEQLNSEVKLFVETNKKSGISSVIIEKPGQEYKVGDLISFSNNSVSAEVSEVLGKNVKTIQITETTNDNLVFSVKDNVITASKETPHGFENGDIIEISGISSSFYKNIEGFRTIKSNTFTTNLALAIGSTTTTGLSTFISLTEPTISKNIKESDVILIGSEQLKIASIDSINNRYFVNRQYNSTVGSSHTSGKIVEKLSTEFTFTIGKKLENTNTQNKYSFNFDATSSVGIGISYSNLIVGYAGTNPIYRSVPARSIYLPNHKFNTGDKLSYVSYGGTIYSALNSSLTPTYDLTEFNDLYCVKLNNDFIGISTNKSGISSSYVYFQSVTGNSHKFENIVNQIKGNAKKISARITLDTQHKLQKNDSLTLKVFPKNVQRFNVKFDAFNKKLVINPVSFASTFVSVGSTQSLINLQNHGYKTGDTVLYSSSANAITPLTKNSIYYVIRVTDDSIQLAENLYDATVFPYKNIGITSFGSGTHELSLINPRLDVYKGNTAIFSVSDPSLVNYTINFYHDKEFNSRYESNLITKIGVFGDAASNTEVQVSIADSLPKELYYRLEGLNSKYINTYPSSVNTDVIDYSKIVVLDSKLNKTHVISGVGSTTIDFTLVGYAETTLYNSSGISSVYYSTNSKNDTGKIHSIKVIDKGTNLSYIPIITSIASTTGSLAELSVETKDIGRIIDTRVNFQGLEFTNNKTLKPKAKTYSILKLDDILTITNVGVLTGGKNYTTPPKTIAIGNSSVIIDTTIRGSSVYQANVISGDSGLSKNLRIIPTNNSNGVGVIDASSSFSINTLTLRAPLLGFIQFPFQVGDSIYVENVKIVGGSGDGYNSSDYGYQYFTVTGINTVSGSESVSYSIAGIGVTGGTFDNVNVFGRVIKKEDLAVYTPVLEKVNFYDSEQIKESTGKAIGKVAKNGWDPELQILKLIDVKGVFSNNDRIGSSFGNFKATVKQSYNFDCDLDVDSVVKKSKTWETDSGKLNYDSQRIHDNDYYQRFSYSIRGEVDYDTWSEPVNSLVHASGFKNFSNYEILNGIGNTIKAKSESSDILLTAELISEASTYDRFYYDLASEDTNINTLSKIIKLDSKVLTDYNEAVTNKVLAIDNISSQFTGFNTTTGGQIVGLTTFTLTSENQSLLHKTFTPSNVNLSDSTITITDHEFNTGENLIYYQEGGTPIGIVTTSVAGIGSTDILPSSVYAIKITKDTIKLAIGKTEAQAETSVTFSTVGVGSTHSLSVENDLALTRCLITVDNVIQSPISKKSIAISLASSVSSASTDIYLNDISKIQGKSLLKIESEIIKVNSVGIGSTNSLSVIRGFMGTVSAAHTIGAATTVLSGDYRIEKGKIYFAEAPYSKSSFSGRVFYRVNYDRNYVIDDISESFNSTTSNFNLTNNGQSISGIQSSFGAMLVNNIFQKPFFGDVGSILESDYRILGTGQTISFTGTGYQDLPKGGVINEFSAGIGSGYQNPTRAYAYAVVSAAGTIQSIGLSTGGSGYIVAPKVSIADTLGIGVGASIRASVTAGVVTSFTIVKAGTGYTSTSLPLVIIDEPSPYSNIPLSGGTGSNATMNVVVGTGGSIISYEIENRGYGYSIGDVLTLTQLPYKVGIGTSAFQITVKNRYQSKFSGWTFGQLLELDDFSNLFNGVRRTFLITRTIVTKEYYSIVAQEGSGIVLQNNLLIFLNDILQRPGIDYTFNGGTRLTFLEAPKGGSKLKIYFYGGSTLDYKTVNVDESIKPGDILRLQRKDTLPSQENRTVYELISSDAVETQTYGGVGISTNASLLRPVVWSKQKSDVIIDGEIISKERDYLEPQIYPNTNIIASVASSDAKIYVKNIYPLFNALDNLSQTLNDVRVVGLGTTAVTEEISGVTYSGDYGLIIGIGTSATGISTSSPVLIFDIIPNPNIVNNVSLPGISTGDYFVVENTIIGSGVTSIKNSKNSIVCIGNSFIDNVYYANHIVSVGSSTLRVYSNVDSLNGINTSLLPNDLNDYGTYTWGSLGVSRGSKSRSFEFYNQNGVLGIETSAYINRTLQLRLSY